MLTFKQFIKESSNFTKIQSFLIAQWGKILYLDYLDLPLGKDESIRNSSEILKLISDYETAGDAEKEQLDEWIAEGAPLKNGTYILSRNTIDSVFKSAQHKAGKQFKIYRYDHTNNKLQSDSWISTTRNKGAYSGKETEYTIEPDDLIIDAHGLADDGEVIVSTNLLLTK